MGTFRHHLRELLFHFRNSANRTAALNQQPPSLASATWKSRCALNFFCKQEPYSLQFYHLVYLVLNNILLVGSKGWPVAVPAPRYSEAAEELSKRHPTPSVIPISLSSRPWWPRWTWVLQYHTRRRGAGEGKCIHFHHNLLLFFLNLLKNELVSITAGPQALHHQPEEQIPRISKFLEPFSVSGPRDTTLFCPGRTKTKQRSQSQWIQRVGRHLPRFESSGCSGPGDFQPYKRAQCVNFL